MAPTQGHAADADESTEGASPWQQLLYAAKTDSQELAATALQKVGDDVNKQDRLGCTGQWTTTARRYAIADVAFVDAALQ